VRPRASVTGFAALEPAPDTVPREGWRRLADPSRAELDPRSEDARFARLDRAARLLALVARRALGERAIAGDRSGLVLGTVVGSLEADERFDESRSLEGGPSPLLFPATLATAPLAELSIRLGLRGPVEVVSAGEASLLEAIALGVRLVEAREAELVLAAGLEVAARSSGALLGDAGVLCESAWGVVLESDGVSSRSKRGVLEVLAPDVAGEVSSLRSDLLGNRAGPELARAFAGREPRVVAVRDGLGFAAALRFTPDLG
jgi:hypothetical protein